MGKVKRRRAEDRAEHVEIEAEEEVRQGIQEDRRGTTTLAREVAPEVLAGPTREAEDDRSDALAQPPVPVPVVYEGRPEVEAEEEPVTDPLQRKALARQLTVEIKQDLAGAARKLCRFHRHRLWQDLGYESFKDYVLLEFEKTRKWGYQQITWFKAVAFLESRGIADPIKRLSKEAALVFRKWEYRPEVVLLAYQRIVERGEQPTQERLDQECEIQAEYLREADRIEDLTFPEYEAYLKLQPLAPSFALDAQTADELFERCVVNLERPSLGTLARVARGDDLLSFVENLEPVVGQAARRKALEAEKHDLEKQKRELTKKLNEQIEELERGIEELGPKPSEDDGGGDHGDEAGGDEGCQEGSAGDEAGAGKEEPGTSHETTVVGVRANLTAAIGHLDAALAAAWPADDRTELREIVKVAQAAEEKVVVVIARAEEFLMDLAPGVV